jgi:hypothetical protein
MDIGHALWKLAQVCMGAFGGALTGLFLGGLFVAVIGSLLGDLELCVLQYGGLGSSIGGVVGGLACGIVVWKDLSQSTSRHS